MDTAIRFNSGITDSKVIELFKWIQENTRKCGGSLLKQILDLEIKNNEMIYVTHNNFRTASMSAQNFTNSFIQVLTKLKKELNDPNPNNQWINQYSLIRMWKDDHFILIPLLDEVLERTLPNGHYQNELDLSQKDYEHVFKTLK